MTFEVGDRVFYHGEGDRSIGLNKRGKSATILKTGPTYSYVEFDEPLSGSGEFRTSQCLNANMALEAKRQPKPGEWVEITGADTLGLEKWYGRVFEVKGTADDCYTGKRMWLRHANSRPDKVAVDFMWGLNHLKVVPAPDDSKHTAALESLRAAVEHARSLGLGVKCEVTREVVEKKTITDRL